MSAGPTNLWHRRLVKDTDAKACWICYKPTPTVLSTPDNSDWFYICPGHLTDPKFAFPKDAEDLAKKAKDAEIEKEIEAVKKEFQEKMKKKMDRQRIKEWEKEGKNVKEEQKKLDEADEKALKEEEEKKLKELEAKKSEAASLNVLLTRRKSLIQWLSIQVGYFASSRDQRYLRMLSQTSWGKLMTAGYGFGAGSCFDFFDFFAGGTAGAVLLDLRLRGTMLTVILLDRTDQGPRCIICATTRLCV